MNNCSFRKVYQVWQEWVLCVCLVSWTKVAPLELSTVVPERDIQERFTLRRTLGNLEDGFVW